VRILINNINKKLNKKYLGLSKKKIEKPNIINKNFQISISHDFPISAIFINKKKAGIDIQIPKIKLKNIEKNFLNNIEIKNIKNNLYKSCVY
jgi:hypothetical protein